MLKTFWDLGHFRLQYERVLLIPHDLSILCTTVNTSSYPLGLRNAVKSGGGDSGQLLTEASLRFGGDTHNLVSLYIFSLRGKSAPIIVLWERLRKIQSEHVCVVCRRWQTKAEMNHHVAKGDTFSDSVLTWALWNGIKRCVLFSMSRKDPATFSSSLHKSKDDKAGKHVAIASYTTIHTSTNTNTISHTSTIPLYCYIYTLISFPLNMVLWQPVTKCPFSDE